MSEKELGFNNEPNQDPQVQDHNDQIVESKYIGELKRELSRKCERALVGLSKFNPEYETLIGDDFVLDIGRFPNHMEQIKNDSLLSYYRFLRLMSGDWADGATTRSILGNEFCDEMQSLYQEFTNKYATEITNGVEIARLSKYPDAQNSSSDNKSLKESQVIDTHKRWNNIIDELNKNPQYIKDAQEYIEKMKAMLEKAQAIIG